MPIDLGARSRNKCGRLWGVDSGAHRPTGVSLSVGLTVHVVWVCKHKVVARSLVLVNIAAGKSLALPALAPERVQKGCIIYSLSSYVHTYMFIICTHVCFVFSIFHHFSHL